MSTRIYTAGYRKSRVARYEPWAEAWRAAVWPIEAANLHAARLVALRLREDAIQRHGWTNVTVSGLDNVGGENWLATVRYRVEKEV